MELTKAIYERRSIRRYTEAEITVGEIEKLIGAAQMAPSWKNSQTARFFVAHSTEAKEKAIDALAEFNKRRAANASCIIICAVKKGISGYDEDGNSATHLGHGFECFDNGLAVQNICLAAYDMGYGSLIMGLYDEQKMREAFEIPGDYALTSIVAIGKGSICPDAPIRLEMEEVLVIK